ncbi:LysR family transcriptional regulator [Pseudonocardia acaciae]|uniref:LysR family transcriptional regulator n=1 Tax=Pseudonocardia acaciae TaxID=551276 RepID=UPI000A008EA9|nr:LysR family transcriptional regulator [Pseudonocardia acaciae]
MWETVELREIRVFLALAEELHFGRTAERLGLTQSRVSQSLRGLEHKLGGQLVHRNSRRVSLTPFGERFRAEAGDAYGRLTDVLRRSSPVNGRMSGTLRLGTFEPCSAGPHLLAIVEAFEARHTECDVLVTEISHGTDPLAALRRGDVDLLAIRLPLGDADVVIGPALTREPRVLAVATDHPLAARESVHIDDIADNAVTECAGVPKSIMEAFIPTHTPSGRPIPRIPRSPVKPFELAALVARGKVVHPTVPSFATHFGQPGIGYVPITGMPPLESALVWPRGRADRRRDEFVDIARRTLADHREERLR